MNEPSTRFNTSLNYFIFSGSWCTLEGTRMITHDPFLFLRSVSNWIKQHLKLFDRLNSTERTKTRTLVSHDSLYLYLYTYSHQFLYIPNFSLLKQVKRNRVILMFVWGRQCLAWLGCSNTGELAVTYLLHSSCCELDGAELMQIINIKLHVNHNT